MRLYWGRYNLPRYVYWLTSQFSWILAGSSLAFTVSRCWKQGPWANTESDLVPGQMPSSIRNQTFWPVPFHWSSFRLVGLAVWEQKRHISHTKQGFFTTGRQSSSPCNIGASPTNWSHRSTGPVCRLGMLAPYLRRIGGNSIFTWLQNSWWLKTQSWCSTEIWSWSNKWASALYPFPWSKGSVSHCLQKYHSKPWRATWNLKFLGVKSCIINHHHYITIIMNHH